VGKVALEGLDGITRVTSGFRNFKEINTVTYDPEKIGLDEMVERLKAAGTFRGIAEAP
jgi:copper chaperone CopZ